MATSVSDGKVKILHDRFQNGRKSYMGISEPDPKEKISRSHCRIIGNILTY